jgi:2-polyprenyl-3-methyl-5-hydroxy-6-metoxy-1,4-benzoquinol methylase
MGVSESYYGQYRQEMIPFIPPSTRRLLDIGCGDGRFGETVKKALPECETWGVEAVPAAAEKARAVNDHVICGSIYDQIDLPAGHFDVVTMNDVLEHLPESESVLAAIRKLLKPDGKLVLSLPNVRYYLNLRDLLFKKDWQYQDFGILDRTHLRFFTQKSAANLLAANGFRVEKVVGINQAQLKTHYRLLFATAPGFFGDMKFPQFAVVATSPR